MTHDDFEREPIPGLPAHLPEGEHIVWQGSPSASSFARNILHKRKIMVYFAIVAAWKFGTGLYDGDTLRQSIMTAGTLLMAAGIVFGIIWWYARAVKRSTIYTITNKRVVMRFGVALPVTFNYPFAQITSADVKESNEDHGSITLGLKEHTKISWAILWPHARPWKLARPEPAIREVADVANVAKLLSENLHAFHNMEERKLAPEATKKVAHAKQSKTLKPIGIGQSAQGQGA